MSQAPSLLLPPNINRVFAAPEEASTNRNFMHKTTASSTSDTYTKHYKHGNPIKNMGWVQIPPYIFLHKESLALIIPTNNITY